MTYVITQPCIGVKDASCVDVCPVDCIHPTQSEEGFDTAEMLYIHPDECIDCGACEPGCPVTAIFPEEDTPPQWKSYIAKNRDVFQGASPPGKPQRKGSLTAAPGSSPRGSRFRETGAHSGSRPTAGWPRAAAPGVRCGRRQGRRDTGRRG